MKAHLLRQDKQFLAELTRNMSYDEKAKVWKDWEATYLAAAEKEPVSYRRANVGRRAANTALRERVNFRREVMG